MDDTAPQWFHDALAVDAMSGEVDVEGCPIRYRAYGDRRAPGLVLVHGGAAHARWWDHLAPLLAGTGAHRVVAVDLSGHGESGWREVYGLDGWAAEVLAVAEAAGISDPPVVIGHSMGGFVAMAAAASVGERLAGTIIVDSPVRRPDPESREGRSGRMFRAPKTYASLDEAMDHFHLIPFQPRPPVFIHDHVARHSLHEVDGGWTWKFDPRIFVRRRDPSPHDFGELLARVKCRIAVIHGALSEIVTPDVTDYMSERLGRTAPFVEVPEAHHHLILDQPLAFVAAVRALLADWEHSDPHAIPGLAATL